MSELLSFLSGLTMQMVFVFSLGYTAYALGQRWFKSSVGIRWCATSILFCWLLSILFSILMSVRGFAPLPATLAALSGLVLVSRGWGKLTRTAQALAEDVARCRDIIAQKGSPIWWVARACFLFLFALLSIRTLALPLLGWDALTYHGVKAGLWVQAQGWVTLNAPGGWEYYQSFFGGGEAFTAWAMLFMHSDLFAGMPDVFFWGLLGLITTCLAREFGLRARPALLVGMAFLCALDLSRMVGTGYVDTCANAFLLGGLLFLVRFGRAKRTADLGIAAAAFALASSVKVNMLAASMLMALPTLILLLRSQRRPIKAYCLLFLTFIAPILPWLIVNYISTGYPLGCTPLSIGPLRLGGLPPNLAWFLDRPDLLPYQLVAEAQAMFQVLAPVGFVLLLTALGVPGLLWGVGRRRGGHILAFLLTLSVILLYFSPSFSVVRLGWASWNGGRFLIPAIVTLAVAGLAALQRFRHGTLLIEGVAVLSVMVGVWTYVQRFVLGRHRIELVFLALSIPLTLLIYSMSSRKMVTLFKKPSLTISICLVFFVITMYIFAQFKDVFRIRAYTACTTMHEFPRYWVAGLSALESDHQPVRIAFTYGAQQISHYAFLFPYLGGHLDNHLLYVSPQRNGFVVPHHPDYLAASHPSLTVWIDALANAGATHVLCLRAPCDELTWMQDHPEMFVRLAGQAGSWGLFRIAWPTPPV